MGTGNNSEQDNERRKELERIKKWIEERRANLDNQKKDEANMNNKVETEEQKSNEQFNIKPRINNEQPQQISEALQDKNYPTHKKDWLLSLPWKAVEPQIHSMDVVAKILDESHYGMEKVKKRLLEHIAVQSYLKSTQGTVLLLLGPPGVGKTSIAKTLAKALKREYVRINLGGIGSAFELLGAASSWKNAQPGLIVKALRQTHSLSPLILLDEIDKIGNDETHGEASNALLEILDSDRTAFKDNFLEVEIDLSHVFFVATANNINDIDPILLDRMEIIELNGYTTEDKLLIARKYIIPSKLNKFNLDSTLFNISDQAVRYIIMKYCPELGIRKLESYITAICRNMVYQLLTEKCTKMIIEPSMIIGLLGKPSTIETTLLDKPEVGTINALGVINDGQGIVIPVEISSICGDGDIYYTGGIGESCEDVFEVIMTIMKTMGVKWGLQVNNFDNYDIHVHAYWPSIKKEGSSIGFAFFIAFLSSLINVPVRNDIAVTGELTLHGKIMPIGGVEPKILAAVQAGIKKVIIPYSNKNQIEKIESSLINELEIVYISSLEELISEALFDLK